MPTPLDDLSWGHASRHYASSGQGQRDALFEALDKRWTDMVKAAVPQAREQVENAFRQWNTVVRDQLRNEMGLRLTVGGEAQSVPVRIVDGVPRAMAEALRTFEQWEWLLLHRPELEATVRGARLLTAHQPDTVALLGSEPPPATVAALTDATVTAERLLVALDHLEAIKRIVGCREDVLGAYFFQASEVRLYWVPLAIVSRLLGVPLDALTVVILAHELAHAYSHLGRDIDGEAWSTQDFADADLEMVEGIAQFYTQVICRGLMQRFPSALHAFDALLANQGPAYTAFQRWTVGQERAGEIVRVAMIECRTKSVTNVKDFEASIDHHRQQVKGRPPLTKPKAP